MSWFTFCVLTYLIMLPAAYLVSDLVRSRKQPRDARGRFTRRRRTQDYAILWPVYLVGLVGYLTVLGAGRCVGLSAGSMRRRRERREFDANVRQYTAMRMSDLEQKANDERIARCLRMAHTMLETARREDRWLDTLACESLVDFWTAQTESNPTEEPGDGRSTAERVSIARRMGFEVEDAARIDADPAVRALFDVWYDREVRLVGETDDDDGEASDGTGVGPVPPGRNPDRVIPSVQVRQRGRGRTREGSHQPPGLPAASTGAARELSSRGDHELRLDIEDRAREARNQRRKNTNR